jgi:hypothetical protein
MREAANRASMSHQMDTTNRGSIMPQADSNMEQGPNRAGRKAYIEPADYMPGENGEVGIGSPRFVNKWDGCFHDDEAMGPY